MIRCLLLLVTRNRQGEPVHEERVALGTALRIGRGTDCALYLPDPRVMFLHATLRPSVHGGFAVHGNGKVIASERGFETVVELPPGSHVLIGPYRLGMEAARPGYDLVLAVELLHPLPDERNALIARSRTALTQTALSMRWLVLLPAALILLAFLALPALHAQLPELRRAAATSALAPDESWNPGPVSAAHRSFARSCGECHQQPFVRVQDQACLACHKDVQPHIADKTLQAGAFGQTRCAQCHREHRENHDLSPGHPGLCVDCHGGQPARRGGLPAIRDFQDDHPPFRPLPENSGLKFPHDVHLVATGTDSPAGRVKLRCASCHEADEAGMRFAPVSMRKHCESCHRLEFEPAITRRTVPHGDERQVMTNLREFYAQVSIGRTPIDVTTIDGLLRRPGRTGEAARLQAGVWAEDKAMAVARELFEVRSCNTCHEISTRPADRDAPWRVAPVRLNRRWLVHARFPHEQHRSAGCVSCHNAARSKSSADVDIPGIETCRSCHAGFRPARNKVASTCNSCHSFHWRTP